MAAPRWKRCCHVDANRRSWHDWHVLPWSKPGACLGQQRVSSSSQCKRCGSAPDLKASFRIAQRISCTLHRESARHPQTSSGSRPRRGGVWWLVLSGGWLACPVLVLGCVAWVCFCVLVSGSCGGPSAQPHQSFFFFWNASTARHHHSESELPSVKLWSLCCLARRESSDKKKTYDRPDRHIITVGAERFRCEEVLSQLNFIGKDVDGSRDTSSLIIMKCDVGMCKDLYAFVVLSGGTTTFQGTRIPKKRKNDGSMPNTDQGRCALSAKFICGRRAPSSASRCTS